MNPHGSVINGREYSGHALERMAPNTPEVQAELHKRVAKRAKDSGEKFENQQKLEVYLKRKVDPRNIPPMVIENAIKNGKKYHKEGGANGTVNYLTEDVEVVINEQSGKVVTVFPKGGK